MKAYLVGYDRVKYRRDSKPILRHVFSEDVTSYKVKTVSVEDIIADTDGSCVDPYDEYLEITFRDGETSTYRNSYFDLFLVH